MGLFIYLFIIYRIHETVITYMPPFPSEFPDQESSRVRHAGGAGHGVPRQAEVRPPRPRCPQLHVSVTKKSDLHE